jgi:hypothetical protein
VRLLSQSKQMVNQRRIVINIPDVMSFQKFFNNKVSNKQGPNISDRLSAVSLATDPKRKIEATPSLAASLVKWKTIFLNSDWIIQISLTDRFN